MWPRGTGRKRQPTHRRRKQLTRQRIFRFTLLPIIVVSAYTGYLFQVDPFSYWHYPIERKALFETLDYPERNSSSNSLRNLTFTEDGQSVFVYRNPRDDWARLKNTAQWDISTGEPQTVFTEDRDVPETGFASNLVISDRQHWLMATKRDPIFSTSVQLRNAETGEVLPAPEGTGELIKSPALSRDGSMLAGMQSGKDLEKPQLNIWETQTGRIIQTLPKGASSIAFSPSGKALALLSGRNLELWDLESQTKRYGQEIPPNEEASYGQESIFFSSDGSILSVHTGGCQIQQIETETGKPIAFLPARKYVSGFFNASSRIVSPDGKTLACSVAEYFEPASASEPDYGFSRNNIDLIDIATGNVQNTIEDVRVVNQIAFGADGQTLAIANAKRELIVYKLASDQVVKIATIEDYGRDFAYVDESNLLLGIDRGGAIALFDPKTGKRLQQIVEPGPINSNVGTAPSISRDGKTLMTVGNSSLSAWKNEDQQLTQQYQHPLFIPTNIKKIVIDSQERQFAAIGQRYQTLYVEGGGVSATSRYDTLIMGDLDTGKIHTYLNAPSEIRDTAFSANGQWLGVLQGDHTAQIRNAQTGELVQTFRLKSPLTLFTSKKASSELGSIAFSQDGNRLVTSDDYSLQLWNAKSGKLQRTLDLGTANGIHFTESVRLDGDFAISPDSKWIAASRPPRFKLPPSPKDNKIQIWDAKSGRLVRTFIPHTPNIKQAATIKSLTFSPDSRSLVAGDDFGRITVWQLPSKLSLFHF